MNRRHFLCIAGAAVPLWATESGKDPWSSSQLMEPAVLAELLRDGKQPPIICVGFPVLYRQKHIAHARLAGPVSKPEGIAQLKDAVATTSKDAQILIYCGCCPMVQCPNLRPAFSLLDELGYKKVGVLNLPANFHTDWADKGYPVESSLPAKG